MTFRKIIVNIVFSFNVGCLENVIVTLVNV